MWLRWLGVLGSVTVLLAGCGGGSTRHGSTSPGGAGAGTGGSGTSTAAGPVGSETATGAGSTSTTGGAAAPPSNGVARRPAPQILAAASRAIQGARSVHVAGTVVDNGIKVGLDLHLSRGQGGQGEISENGLGFRLVSTGKFLYIQGSDSFWAHFGGARATKLFRGKWLKAPDAGQFGTLGRLATTRGLVAQLFGTHGRLSRAGRTIVGGQPAVRVVDRTQGGTLFVAATGPPYPLEIVKQGTNGGYVKFTQFNQPVAITPPRKAISLPAVG